MAFLARLSLWGLSATAYERRVRPLLQKLDFPPSQPCQRPPRDGVLSRLFVFEDVDAFTAARRALESSAAWLRLSADAGGQPPLFSLYEAEGPLGLTVAAGSGQRRGDWLSYGVDDGLCSSLVLAAVADRRDRLWMRTYDGVGCFDGQRFTSYSVRDGLPSNVVQTIFEDRAGHMWFGTERDGLCRCGGRGLSLYTVADGLPGQAVSGIVEDGQGRMWVSTAGGRAAYLEDGRFVEVPIDRGQPAVEASPDESAEFGGETGGSGLWVDRSGGVWLLHPDGAVYRAVGDRFMAVAAADGSWEAGARTAAADDRGRVVCGGHGGLRRWDGSRLQRLALPGDLAAEAVWPVRLDDKGRLWCRTSGGTALYLQGDDGLTAVHAPPFGIREIDGEGRLWGVKRQGVVAYDGRDTVEYGVEDGLPHATVYAIARTGDGAVWCSTWGGGICRFEGDRFAHYLLGEGRVEAVLRDRCGRLWFGTFDGCGLHCLEAGRWRVLGTADGLPSDNIWCLHEDGDGYVWIGTQQGLCRYDGETFRNFTTADGLSGDSIWCLYGDRAGTMWVGVQYHGACRFDGQGFVPVAGLPEQGVWAIVEDDGGDLWFSVFNQGVWRRRGEGRFEQLTVEDGLGHNQVWCMYRDRRGDLWFGTWGGGVTRWDGTGLKTYSFEDGLAYNHVRAIAEDARGQLWFCTFGGGASCFDGQVFQVLAKKDGLVHDSVQGMAQDADGALWFATEAGVTRYRPQSRTPRVEIEDIVTDRRHGAVKAVKVASRGLAVFEFAATSFNARPRRMAYVFRLSGHDEGWRTTYASKAEYHGLPPGAYVFEVRAVDRDLNYSAAATVDVEVVSEPRQDRIEALEAELSQAGELEDFVGRSAALQEALDKVRTAAQTDITVLIIGETGTGKGLAARAVHSLSSRRGGPFIQVNCAAIPEGLIESELFGHEKGAFTGAVARRLGRFELAAGGTIFLDEIGDLPLALQQVLLEVLQEGTFRRVGGDRALQADVRVIAATNRNLRQAMEKGRFREDLFFRLCVFEVELPPLRRRAEDVPLLVRYFAARFARHLNRPVPRINPEVLGFLQGYAWPGNVRQLEHLVQQAILVCRDDVVRLSDIPVGETALEPAVDPELDGDFVGLEQMERRYILRALEACNWIVYGPRGAAGLLEVHPERLRAKMRKLGLVRPPKR